MKLASLHMSKLVRLFYSILIFFSVYITPLFFSFLILNCYAFDDVNKDINQINIFENTPTADPSNNNEQSSFVLLYHRPQYAFDINIIRDNFFSVNTNTFDFYEYLCKFSNLRLDNDSPFGALFHKHYKHQKELKLKQDNDLSKHNWNIYEFIGEDHIFLLFKKILEANSVIESMNVYSGLYLDKIKYFNWEDSDQFLLNIKRILTDISTDLNSDRFSYSRESISEIIEILRIAWIAPIAYYHKAMNSYLDSNRSYYSYRPSKLLFELIPDRYLTPYQQTRIFSLNRYGRYMDDILDAVQIKDKKSFADFKHRYQTINDFEIITAVAYLENFFKELNTFKSKFNLEGWSHNIDAKQYFETSKSQIQILDYKPLVDKYYEIEQIMELSGKILDKIYNSTNEYRFLRYSYEPIKTVNQHLLLLLRFSFFDVPLSYDSVFTIMKIEKSKGIFNDNEKSISAAAQAYGSLKPILLVFNISPSVHEMFEEILLKCKSELNSDEMAYLNQRVETQPSWLKKPVLNLK
jgi:hypothetical protein